jgi:hypothetical protein
MSMAVAEARYTHRRESNYVALAMLMVLSVLSFCTWAEEVPTRVQVADPYLELHTGPGRGYPVFYVADRGEWVKLLKRHTDWFKVRTDKDKEGWVSRDQMESTLNEAGVKTTFRDTLFDDYLLRRVEVGFGAGQLDSDALLTAHVGYGISPNFSVELTLAQAVGNYSSTALYYGSLLAQPFPEWRVAPFFSLGLGRFHNTPKATLVGGAEVDANMANTGLGVRAYVTRRFILRADYRRHVAFISENRINEFNELSLGISLFF